MDCEAVLGTVREPLSTSLSPTTKCLPDVLLTRRASAAKFVMTDSMSSCVFELFRPPQRAAQKDTIKAERQREHFNKLQKV